MDDYSTQCQTLDGDAGRCQLQDRHDSLHLAFADGAVLAWSVPTIEVHRYSAHRIALWVHQAPWMAGYRPVAV